SFSSARLATRSHNSRSAGVRRTATISEAWSAGSLGGLPIRLASMREIVKQKSSESTLDSASYCFTISRAKRKTPVGAGNTRRGNHNPADRSARMQPQKQHSTWSGSPQSKGESDGLPQVWQ